MSSIHYTQVFYSFVAGLGLGTLYFYLIWKSVKEVYKRTRTGLFLRFVVRFMVIAVSFSAMALIGGWQALIAALLGFTTVRIVAVRKMQIKKQNPL